LSDNQPFKAAEFQDFLRTYNVSWHSSSPHYPQSNGRAEAEIKQIKKLICGSKVGGKWDAEKMSQALMLFRNAPRCGGGSSPERHHKCFWTTDSRRPSSAQTLIC
jgi:transposase InsO family protein